MEQFFRETAVAERHRASPVVGPYLDGLTQRLAELGYAVATIRSYIYACEEFGQFLSRRRVDVRQIDETHIEHFLKEVALHRRWRGRRINPTVAVSARRAALAFFLAQLREVGITVTSAKPIVVTGPPHQEVLESYLEFLCKHRGLHKGTIGQHRLHVDRFLRHIGESTQALESLSAPQIDRFLSECSKWISRRSMCRVSAALRGFLRYLHLCGRFSRDLSSQVATPRVYRMETVPRALSWSDVRKLLQTPDRTTVAGRRDYAILLLLALYGLRASEVVALSLDDLDWQASTLRVRHWKSDDSSRYPLHPDVGEALIDYLRRGRPAAPVRQIFLTLYPPPRPFAGSNAIGNVVARYLHRANINAPHWGAHTLRHSHAVQLLRNGFSLKAIGDLLGHRHPQSTFIYAKAAVDDLRDVALDIRGVLS